MALKLNDDGVTVIRLRHVEAKSDGSFQYRRRIPETLRERFPGKSFFVKSLGRDRSLLSKRCYEVTHALEDSWNKLGWSKGKVLASIGHRQIEEIVKSALVLPEDNVISLSGAMKLYLSLHSNGSRHHFSADCERIVKCVITLVGDLPLNSYARSHAEIIRDSLAKDCATSTVRRRLTTLVAIINKARKEKQLQIVNPFEGLGIVGEGEDGTKRIPFDNRELRVIADACHNFDDDIRHIIALQLDTGSRVAEVVGLRVEDVLLSHSIPHVRIRPWGKVRTLKTAASERDIPLVGNALWAAERAVEARRKAAGKNSWLFPRYASDAEVKATHASATLNKWLRSLSQVSSDKTTHCFRHAMRDRLRAAQVPFEIQECLGGWGSRTIGQGYGNGYPLQVLAEHMQKVALTSPEAG